MARYRKTRHSQWKKRLQKCGLLVLYSFLSMFIVNTSIASILMANWMQSTIQNDEGMSIYQYESSTEISVGTKAEFDSYTYTNASFEAGQDDLISYTDTTDYLELGYFGDNVPNTDENDWWDDDADSSTQYNWPYRKCFAIDHTDASASTLDEYQIYLDIDTATAIAAGRMNSDGSDIRFVDEDDNEMSYFIADDMNESSTRIWVQIDDITASTTEDICIYYGNSSATASSDRVATFDYSSSKEIYTIVQNTAEGTDLEFVSYMDSNTIEIDSLSKDLDEFEFFPDATSVSQGDALSSLAPYFPVMNGNGGDALSPISFAGTEFAYRMDRGTNEFSIYAPFCDADLEFYNETGASLTGGSFTVTAGSVTDYLTNDSAANGLANDDAVVIDVTNACPVLITHHATSDTDVHVMHPTTTEWYGVGSGNLEIAAATNGTTVDVYYSDGTSTSIAMNRGDNQMVGLAGSQGSEVAVRVVADFPIGVDAIADGDGSEKITFLPVEEMDYRYYLPLDMQYVTIATIEGETTTVDLYNDATSCGTGVPDDTATVSPSSTFPGKVYFGSTTAGVNISGGACVVADNPISIYYEFQDQGDEHNVWSTKQHRQYLYPEPTDSTGSSTTSSWTLGESNTFTRRTEVTIDNNSTTDAMDEYTYRLELDSTSYSDLFTNAQSDGGDIRVAGSTGGGSDNYTYWLESYDGSSEGVLWIQTTSIAASGSETLYIYYDASTSTSTTGNQNDTFTYSTAKDIYYLIDATYVGLALEVISMVDGNEITIGGEISTLNEGEKSISIDDNDTISVLGPIHAGFTGNTTEAVFPIAFYGTEFGGYAARSTDSFSIHAPFADANITLEQSSGTGWTSLTTQSVTAGTVTTFTQDVTNARAFRIISDEPVFAFHENSGSDSKMLYPVDQALEENGDYELWGVGANSLLLSTTQTGTTVDIYRSDGTTTSVTLDTSNNMRYTESGGGAAQGEARAYHLVADGPISASSYADSDGGEAVVFLPQKEFSDTYALSGGTQYMAIVARDQSVTCRVYDDTGTEVTTGGATMDNVPPQTGGTNSLPYPNKIHIGGNDTSDGQLFFAGYSMVCDEPVYAYIERHEDSSQTDESTWLTWPQGRQRAFPEPSVEDPDSLNEEGLFYESGFDSAGASTDPEAYVEVEIDLSATTYGEHVYLQKIDWNEITNNRSSENSVEQLTFEVATADSGGAACSGATYSSYTALTSTTLSTSDDTGISYVTKTTSNKEAYFNDDMSDADCIRIRAYLRTGDEAYSPQLQDFSITYFVPTLMVDQLNTPTMSVTGNTSSTEEQRLIKAELTGSGFNSSEAELTYIDVSDGSVFTSMDLDLYELTNDSIVSQFSFPAFPGSESESGNPASFDQTNSVSLNMSHLRSAGGTETLELRINCDILGSGGPQTTREFQVEISG